MPTSDELMSEMTTGEEAASGETDHQRVQDAVEAVMARVRESELRDREKFRRYEEIDRLYHAQSDPSDKRGGRGEPGSNRRARANATTLDLYRSVNSVTSAVDAVAFGDQPFFEPEDESLDDQTISELFQTKAVLERNHEAIDLRSRCMAMIRSGLKFCTLVAEVWWDERRAWRYNPETRQDEEVIVHRRPTIKGVVPWRFYKDVTADRVEQASWAAVERELSRKELEAMLDYARAQGGAVMDIEDIDSGQAAEDTAGQQTSETIQNRLGTTTDRTGTYHVIDYWGLHPTQLDPRDEGKAKSRRDPRVWRMVVVNQKHLAIEMLNPYWHGRLPFLDWRPEDEEEGFEGWGPGLALRESQIILNEQESMSLDMTYMAQLGMYNRKGGMFQNMPQVVRFFPGRIFDEVVDGLLERMDIDTTGVTLASGMMDRRGVAMQVASGATSNVQALPGSGDTTATEFRGIASEAARRLASYAITFSNQILKPFLELEGQLYNQFIPEAEELPIFLDHDGHRFTMRPTKETLRFSGLRVRMRVASDIEFRKGISRNINQTLKDQSGLIQAVAMASPQVAVELAQGMIPVWVLLMKKQIGIYGFNPEETFPPGIVEELKNRMEIARSREAVREEREQARADVETGAAVAPPEEAVDVPVAP